MSKVKEPSLSVFKDRNKEASFWEKNFKEVIKSAKPVEVRFAKNLSKSINIRLDDKTLAAVRVEAAKKGIGPTQLIRMWIKERLATLGSE